MTKRTPYRIETETIETEVEQFYHDSHVGLSHQWLTVRQPYFWVIFNESRRAKEVKTVEGPFETEAEARQWAHNAFEPCRDY